MNTLPNMSALGVSLTVEAARTDDSVGTGLPASKSLLLLDTADCERFTGHSPDI